MPNDNANELSDSARIALAHLGMLVQIANGSHRAQAGEIEKRSGAISAYIRTGQLLASDQDRELIGVIQEYLSSGADMTPKIEVTG